MLDQKQADAAAEALLVQSRAQQVAQQRSRVDANQRFTTQRRAAQWGLLGLGLGAVIGHFGFERWFPGAMLGFTLGAVAGRWLLRRRGTSGTG